MLPTLELHDHFLCQGYPSKRFADLGLTTMLSLKMLGGTNCADPAGVHEPDPGPRGTTTTHKLLISTISKRNSISEHIGSTLDGSLTV
jgi:hypothetical protein